MKGSPYIEWAKKHHEVKYNLAGSGVPAPSLPGIVEDPKEILKSGHHEDGWPPLIDRIADRYQVRSRQVVPVHSTSLANHLVCALLLDPGDEVLVENPAYEPLVSLPRYFNAEVKRFGRNRDQNYQPDTDEIEKKLTGNTRLIILTNLHNPSGQLLEEEKLQKIIKLAGNYDAHILIDEVYLEFLYPFGKRTTAKKSDRIITTRSLTKAYGLDDIRVGWIIAGERIAEKLRQLKNLFITSMAFPSERIGAIALDKADDMLKRNRALIKKNFSLVSEFIEEQDQLSWQAPQYGPVGFVKYRGKSVIKLVEHALNHYHTIVAPGEFFGNPSCFRIGWGLAEEKLQKGLEGLAKSINEL